MMCIQREDWDIRKVLIGYITKMSIPDIKYLDKNNGICLCVIMLMLVLEDSCNVCIFK